MPLALLNPRLDLATLANMDEVPGIASDWLHEQYRDQPDNMASDVLLMWGQGLKLPPRATVTYPPSTPGAAELAKEIATSAVQNAFKGIPTITPPGFALSIAEPHWHLPQPTLAIWAGHAYGDERRQAVERWFIYQAPSGDWLVGKRVAGNVYGHHRDHAGADRELRRLVARLFTDFWRRIVIRLNLHEFRHDASQDGGLSRVRRSLCERGFLPEPHSIETEVREVENLLICRQNVYAWDFVPPEPHTEVPVQLLPSHILGLPVVEVCSAEPAPPRVRPAWLQQMARRLGR